MSYVVDVLPTILSLVQSATTGTVNSYPRHSNTISTHNTLFVAADNKFRGWIIDRASAPSTGAPGNQVFRTHNVVLTGYWGLKDSIESSNDFQEEIDTMLATFDALVTLGDTDLDQLGTPQLVTKNEEMFGGILCHKCEIVIAITEETTP